MSQDSANQSNLEALYESSQRNEKFYLKDNPTHEVLETFKIEGDRPQVVRISTNEFSSVCPVTGQPDWADIYVSYIPGRLCIESKSLKLYLMRFRNHGEFHESCVQRIFDDIMTVAMPHALQVVGDFTARGGLAIKPISCHVFDPAEAPAYLLNHMTAWGTTHLLGSLR